LKNNLLEKKESFKIETVTYDTNLKSRDIEVKIGSLLEKLDFKVDMQTPKQLMGIISKKNKIYIGSSYINCLLYTHLNLLKIFSKKI